MPNGRENMETACSHYFLSVTAIQAWRTNDITLQNRMFECVSQVHKASWFRRIIYKGIIPEYRLNELAENVFLSTWGKFTENGKAGKLVFSGVEYTGYLFVAFKGNYIKLLEKEIKLAKAEKEYSMKQTIYSEFDFEIKEDTFFSLQTQGVLNKIGENCSQLLKWKHVEGLSYDEIAERKKISRESCIKIASRCKTRFLEIYYSFKN